MKTRYYLSSVPISVTYLGVEEAVHEMGVYMSGAAPHFLNFPTILFEFIL